MFSMTNTKVEKGTSGLPGSWSDSPPERSDRCCDRKGAPEDVGDAEPIRAAEEGRRPAVTIENVVAKRGDLEECPSLDRERAGRQLQRPQEHERDVDQGHREAHRN